MFLATKSKVFFYQSTKKLQLIIFILTLIFFFRQDLASRFGGGEELVDSGEVDNVPSISVNANAKGNKGAWSSSSTSIDSNGKATYETRSGKVDK